jgi:Nucleotidyl transferase AbiEii toxin, Type IV TA system
VNRIPDRSTIAGSRYLDLRRVARATGRPTDELLQLYALEGFLDRMLASSHAGSFVLKGGFLLPAFTERRPTRDIDLSAQAISNDVTHIESVVNDILATPIDDGITFYPDQTRSETTRDEDAYAGVRVSTTGTLATAKLAFHVDINVGDPIWPTPNVVALPRVLGGEPIRIVGYPVEMVMAEKYVTAIQRGTANTRWRDFVDLDRLAQTSYDQTILAEAIQRVAAHRGVTIVPLHEVLVGYADVAQQRWTAWRRKQHLETTTPESFSDLLAPIFQLEHDIQ